MTFSVFLQIEDLLKSFCRQEPIYGPSQGFLYITGFFTSSINRTAFRETVQVNDFFEAFHRQKTFFEFFYLKKYFFIFFKEGIHFKVLFSRPFIDRRFFLGFQEYFENMEDPPEHLFFRTHIYIFYKKGVLYIEGLGNKSSWSKFPIDRRELFFHKQNEFKMRRPLKDLLFIIIPVGTGSLCSLLSYLQSKDFLKAKTF